MLSPARIGDPEAQGHTTVADSREPLRIAVVSLYQAFPPESGAAVVTFELAKHLEGAIGLFQLGERGQEANAARNLRVYTVAGSPRSRAGKLLAMHFSVRRIGEKVRGFRPDVVIVEGASWAVYVEYLVRHLRRLHPGLSVVYHAHNVEYLLRANKSGRAIAKLTRRAEGRLISECEQSYAVSPVDQERFLELYGRRPGLLPNGVSFADWEQVEEQQVSAAKARWGIGERAVLFTGLYAYPPNGVAVDFLVTKVMPLVLARCPEAQLVVTGGDVPFKAPWFVNPGVLPRRELLPLMLACKASACPIFSGSGTRLKILEAIAAGLPVVSTEKGAEGLGAIAGQHYLPAETEEQFSAQLVRATEADDEMRSMTHGASEWARERFAWGNIARDLQNALGGFARKGVQCR